MSQTAAMPLPTLADVVRPARAADSRVFDVMAIVAGIALVSACAQVAVPMPSGVPITGQTFGVLLVGAALGAKRGAMALAGYVALGLAGVPVLAMGHAGFPPATFGYLLGFVPAAFVVGLLAQRGWDRGRGGMGTLLAVARTALAMTIGTLIIFALGIAWYATVAMPLGWAGVTEMSGLLGATLWPYLPGAVVKIALAMVLLPGVWKVVGPRKG
ncbi:MAG: biotin transporter BioY [Phycisphaeraceae bacterium]|nr:MAG: biotin transporter BioY [Phycisphaeraceae bacterium]